MAYARYSFNPDSQRERFQLFQPKISKTRIHITTGLQLLSIFLMLRVVMIVAGLTLVNLPMVDAILRNCIALIS